MPAPTRFAPLPAAFHGAPKVEVMREEFGVHAMAVLPLLMCEAETQNRLSLKGERGVVRMTYRTLAYKSGSTPEGARAVVERWAELGEMVDAEFRDLDFTARWRDWDRWQEPPADPKLSEAKSFLLRALGHGARPAALVAEAAAAQDISEMTLKRARAALGVQSTRGPGAALSLPDDESGSTGSSGSPK